MRRVRPYPNAVMNAHEVTAITRFVAKRVIAGLGVLAVVAILTFGSMEVLPGNAAQLRALGLTSQAPPELIHQEEHQLGLDRPIPERFWEWATGLLRGDLGVSLLSQRPVGAIIRRPLFNTITLGIAALVIGLPLALLAGVITGMRAGSRIDQAVTSTAIGIVAIPSFVLGTLLITLFAFKLGWLPAVSVIQAGQGPLSDPNILMLPAVTLGVGVAAYGSRFVRASVADTVRTRYVELARLNGIGERRVIFRHILPNALAPWVQVLASMTALLVGGAVLVETLFAYPGIGAALADAVSSRDVPLVEGITMLITATLVAAYILADVAVVLLVPRLRTAL